MSVCHNGRQPDGFSTLRHTLICFIPPSLKERKVHAAIDSFLSKMRMVFKRVLFAMFQNKEAAFFQYVVCEYLVGDSLQVWQFIGRVGKDEVELFPAALYVLEYIASYGKAFIGFHFLHHFTDEGIVFPVFFHADDLLASARHQFDADAACACKEVKRTYVVFKVEVVGC